MRPRHSTSIEYCDCFFDLPTSAIGNVQRAARRSKNGGVREDSAIPARAFTLRTKAVRTATASERPSVGLGRARGNEPARIPQWHPGQYEVPTNEEPRHQPARQETRPNQRLYVPLGSPPSVAVGSSSARAAHRSRAPIFYVWSGRSNILSSPGDGESGAPRRFASCSAAGQPAHPCAVVRAVRSHPNSPLGLQRKAL